MHQPPVRPAWRPLLEALEPAPWIIQDLLARYSEPHRVYHGLTHVDALAADFAAVRAGPTWNRPAEVAAAVLYHDAIYEIGQPDNEVASGRLAERAFATTGIDLPIVVALIEATAHHTGMGSADPDVAHFLDCDMAILGTDPDTYDRYEHAVFEEYTTAVPPALYWPGRAAFLRSTLAAERIFSSVFFRDRLETMARDNLRRAIDAADRAA